MAKSKNKNNNFFLKQTLKDICKAYPNIDCSKIELFAPVYYPIANIELTVEEKSFEDFETVQLTILKLINIGYKKPKIIADLLGLNELYVNQIFELLLGYRYIDKQCDITELGRESAEAEQKISYDNEAIQRFQMDAINCVLIRLDKEIYHGRLLEKDKVSTNIMILDSADGVDGDVIEKTIRRDDYKELYCQKSNFLNANVKAIKDIKCEELLYAQCVFLKLHGMQGIIFANRKDFTKKKASEKFYWQPFAVDNENTANFLGLTDYRIYNDKNVIPYFESLLYSVNSENLQYNIEKQVNYIVKNQFSSDYISIDIDKREITLLSHKCFSTEIQSTILLLLDFYNYGFSLIMRENLYGRMIKIITDDKMILEAANKIGKAKELLTVSTIKQKILGYINKNSLDDFNVIEIINIIFKNKKEC